MCFFPMGGMGGGGGLSGFLIPPSSTGRKLTNVFKPLVLIHFFMCIIELIAGRYADGAFDLIGALIGLYVIRNPDGFGMQSLCCYIVFAYILFGWDIIRAALYFSGSDSGLAPGPDWQWYLFLFVIMAMPFVLVTVATLGYFIRKDLQKSIAEMQEQMAEMLGQAPGGGQQQQQQQRQPGGIFSGGFRRDDTGEEPQQGAGGQPPASQQRTAAPSGFRAFQGTGNRLGS